MSLLFLSFLFVVFGNIGNLNLLTNEGGAACLDGSPPAYYLAPGTAKNKWYIHHEGGGWCYNLDACLARSTTALGSTKNAAPTMNFNSAYFSFDPTINPLMHDWNKVFFLYCDGGSFSGANASVTNYKGKNLYFRGFHNLISYHKNLEQKYAFQSATDVVVSGCSAGGLATFLHVDWWAALVPKAKVIGLPDSGFFLDYDAPSVMYASKMRWVFNQMDSSSGVNRQCILRNSANPSNCIFAEHTSPHIVTPIFPMQSEYDTWQTTNVLGSHDAKKVNEFGVMLTDRVRKDLLINRRNGIFLDSCSHHCGEWDTIVINSTDIAHAFQKFYMSGGNGDYLQDRAYPCEACCKRGLN